MQDKRKIAPASSMRDRSTVEQKPKKAFYSEGGEAGEAGEAGEGVRRKTSARKDRKHGFMPERFLGFLRSLFFASRPSL